MQQSTQRWRRWRGGRPVLYGALALVAGIGSLVGGAAGAPAVFAHAGAGAGAPPPSAIVSQTTDSQGHVHITYASGVKVTDGDQATLPTPTVTGTASVDFQAFVKNGDKPMVTPLYAMVQSTSGVETEVSPPIAEPNCVQPPANFDITSASASDLALYGLPPVPTQGMMRAQYNQKFGWMKHRVCSEQVSNAPLNRAADSNVDSLYAGNVADQNTCPSSYHDVNNANTGLGCVAGTPYNYTEADADWVIPHFLGEQNNSPVSSMSGWVGVGGVQITYNQLTQAGVSISAVGNIPSYSTWFEYASVNGGQQVQPDNVNIGAGPGSHIYARVNLNSYTLGNIDTDDYYSIYGWGPLPDEASAEFIVERNGGSEGLADYGSLDFKGIGVTEQSLGYESMFNAEHDYFRLYDDGTLELAHVGNLVTDPNDYPGDDNTITWENACNGVCP